MTLALNFVRLTSACGISALVVLLGGSASTVFGNAQLTCTIPSNCVSSQETGDLMPLRFAGTQAQALELLRATVATFPEASIVRADPLGLQLILTTPVGFRDEVDFRIDAVAQLISFRSHSLFGLFDFSKNRSRMSDFTKRFEQSSQR